MNNDGDVDVLMGCGDSLTWIENSGDDTFSTIIRTISIDQNPVPAAADYDRDGDQDVIVGKTAGSDDFLIVRNGTTSTGTAFPFAGWVLPVPGPQSPHVWKQVEPVDLNKDGWMDVVYASDTVIGTGINEGGLNFTSYRLSTGGFIGGFATGELVDTTISIAVCRTSGVSILAGGLELSASGTECRTIAAGDMDNDGKTDLVFVKEEVAGGVYVLVNTGPISSSATSALGDGTFIRSLEHAMSLGIADLNEDSILDIAVTTFSFTLVDNNYPANFTKDAIDTVQASSVWIIEGTGSAASFLTPVELNQRAYGPALVGDVTGDGLADILIPSLRALSTVYVLPQAQLVKSACAGKITLFNITASEGVFKFEHGKVGTATESASDEDCVFKIEAVSDVVLSVRAAIQPSTKSSAYGVLQLFDRPDGRGEADVSITASSGQAPAFIPTTSIMSLRWVAPNSEGAAFTVEVTASPRQPSTNPQGINTSPSDSSSSSLVLGMGIAVGVLACIACIAGVLVAWKSSDDDKSFGEFISSCCPCCSGGSDWSSDGGERRGTDLAMI